MDLIAATLLVLSLLATVTYARRRIGGRMSLSLLLFASLMTIHCVPMLVYVYVTGPDTVIFETALSGLADQEGTLAKMMFAVSLMFVCLMLGSEAGLVVAPRWRRAAKKAFSAQRPGELARILRIDAPGRLLLWVLVLAMLAVSLDQSHLSRVIDFFNFSGTEIEKTQLRAELGGTPYYAYNVLLYSVAPFLVMVSWANDGRRTGNWRPSLLTFALFSLVLLGKFGTLSKAPPVIFLLQLLLMRALLRGDQLNVRLILQFVVAGVLLFATMVRLTFPELDLSGVGAFLYYRVFDIPNEVLLEYFAAVPASIPHTWGRAGLAAMGLASPGDSLQTYFAVAEVTRGSILSSSNVMFIGDAWAQFAWPGVAVTSALMAFTVRLIDLHAQAAGRSDLSSCLTAGGAFGIVTCLSTAFTTALITGGLAILPFLAAAFVERRRPSTERSEPGTATHAVAHTPAPQ